MSAPDPSPGREPEGALPTRRLGRSPVRVTELSFGGAAIGNLFTEVTEEDARAAVDAAWAGGIRAFDTAPHYGLGLSELRLGEALRHRPRAQYVISTKVGRLLDPAAIHDPDDHGEQAFREAYPALERMRDEGMVGAIGVGMNQVAMLTRFVTETGIDVVLVAGRYTLLDRSAGAALLPAAARHGVSVIAGGVFNSGLLAAPRPGAAYDYQAAPAELVARAIWHQEVCARFGVPLRAAAARFPLTHPAVASVLIGARNAAEVTDAIRLHALSVPDALWTALAAAGGENHQEQ